MTVILNLLIGLFLLLLLALIGVWALGMQQPSRRFASHERIIFVALKLEGRAREGGTDLFTDTALWRGHAQHTLIGLSEAYFTDYFLLPADTDYKSGIEAAGAVADAYVADVALFKVPGFMTGVLRGLHLLGITRRPKGALSVDMLKDLGRQDILPTVESATKTRDLPADTQVTMVNYLEYFATPDGDKQPGRSTYQRYGAQAMRAVHSVGGQFLFAGKIAKVLVPSTAEPVHPDWDDLAAMIYPDPEAIFTMEQFGYYQAALHYRDEGLKSSKVVASIAY